MAKGCSQKEGVDFQETFAPVVKYETVRCLLSTVAEQDLEMAQFDVKTAFLNGTLDKEIFMEQPEGFLADPKLKCKLVRSLYGLKQSPRCWNQAFTSFLTKFGFRQSDTDHCLFVSERATTLMLALYVDDGLIVGSSKTEVEEVLRHLKKGFEITIVNPDYFVGFQIFRERKEKRIVIHQKGYINRVLERFNLDCASAQHVPIDSHTRLTADMGGSPPFDVKRYQEAVGSLIYAMCLTRPDISFVVSRLSRYFNAPKQCHWKAAVRVIKYLALTRDLAISYNFGKGTELVGYSDSDFAADQDTRRSQLGFIYLLNGGPVSWTSTQQKSVSVSTTEAEYVALSEASKEAIWLRRLLSDMGKTQENPTILWGDNQGANKLVRNPEFHKRSKHIDVRYHFVREKEQEGEIKVQYIPTQEQLADGLTKALTRDKFIEWRNSLGMNPIPANQLVGVMNIN